MKRLFLSLVLLYVYCTAGAQITYHDASQFLLLGKISDKTETLYERLPAHLKGVSRDPVWGLGKNTAGLAIRFRSNTSAVSVRWTTLGTPNMNHMALTGQRGVDLYCLRNNKWQYVNTGRPNVQDRTTEQSLITNMGKEDREFMLYLPLYDGVTSIEIGIEADATIGKPQIESPVMKKPIVAYGTSILQGGCASRPGMAHTNILSRWLNREFINLGFSGNGILDMEIAEEIAKCDASIFIIDCMPNVETDGVNERLEKFYRIIRDKNPETPIIFIENPMFPSTKFNPSIKAGIQSKNDAMHTIFQKLKEEDNHLYMVLSDEMIGLDEEATVDAIHFTDLGFMRYAEYLYPKLNLLLQD